MPARWTFSLELKRSLVYRAAVVLAGLFPLTLQGCICLLVAALALSVFGYGAMDLVVFALAVCALAILVFSLFCAVIGGIVMQRRISRILREQAEVTNAISVEAGFPNETGFSLPALNYFPLTGLTWRIVYPDFVDTRIKAAPTSRLMEEVVPQKRCLTDSIVRQFTVADVLGLCRYTWRQRQVVRCMVLPRANTVKPLPLLRSATSEDGLPNPAGDPVGDRMEIRPYAPGDSVRDIMWKVYARSRQLNVRLPEKSVFHSRRTIAYLLSSDDDEAAAAVARIALETGAFGENWAFAADGTEQPCNTVPQALEAVARSRGIDAPHPWGLDRFLEQAAGAGGAHCIVFAAAGVATWLERLKTTTRRFPGHFSLVLATDGFGDAAELTLWRRLLLKPSGKSGGTPGGRAELRRLLTETSQSVESTLVVDRSTGLNFDDGLRRV